jgi:hypothetical protein
MNNGYTHIFRADSKRVEFVFPVVAAHYRVNDVLERDRSVAVSARGIAYASSMMYYPRSVKSSFPTRKNQGGLVSGPVNKHFENGYSRPPFDAT